MQPKCARRPSIFSRGALPVFAILSALSGCKPSLPAPPPPAPLAGVHLRVACPDERVAGVVRQFGERWAVSSGASVSTTIAAEPGDADVWVIAPADLGRAAPTLSSIPAEVRASGQALAWNQILPTLRNHQLVWERREVVLPLLGEGVVGVYRADIFSDPKHRQAFAAFSSGKQLSSVPTTWQEVADAAAYFASEAAPAWETGGRPTGKRTSLPPLPRDDDRFDLEFHAVAAPCVRAARTFESLPNEAARAVAYHGATDRAGRPTLDRPGYVAALTLLKRLQQYRPAEPSDRPAEAFRAGRAVFALVTLPELATLPRAGLGICRVPGSAEVEGRPVAAPNYMPYLGAGGWLMGVTKNSANQDAAFQLLVELAGPENGQRLLAPPIAGGPTREAHTSPNNLTPWKSYDLTESQVIDLSTAMRLSYGTPPANPFWKSRRPDRRERQAELLVEVREAIAGRKEPAAALQAAAAQWSARDAKLTEAERLTLRRLDLGTE